MTSNVQDKMLIARAQDAVSLCERQNCIKSVGFLTPVEAEMVRQSLGKTVVRTVFWGGYEDAERTLFVALPDYMEESDELGLISVIEISGRDIEKLRHPDFLGSILGLGIKRDKLGDILVLDDRCFVFVDENIADYIVENLTKVGNKGVTLRRTEPGEVEIPKRKVERFHATVAALRLDSVIAAAIKTSRAGASEVISDGRVFVNWTQQESTSFKMKPGDVFSVRGAGKFRLSEEVSETKKGRLSVYIEKMI